MDPCMHTLTPVCYTSLFWTWNTSLRAIISSLVKTTTSSRGHCHWRMGPWTTRQPSSIYRDNLQATKTTQRSGCITQRRKMHMHEYRRQEPPLPLIQIQLASYLPPQSSWLIHIASKNHPHPGGHTDAACMSMMRPFQYDSACAVIDRCRSVVGEDRLPLPPPYCHCNRMHIRRLPWSTRVPPPIFMTQNTVYHSPPDTYPSYTRSRALGASAPLPCHGVLQRGSSFATCKAGTPAPA